MKLFYKGLKRFFLSRRRLMIAGEGTNKHPFWDDVAIVALADFISHFFFHTNRDSCATKKAGRIDRADARAF